ncbi:MAG TPA: low molecular weight phosphatase family protein [Xanthobacteraceae bacterium]|jgi:protein-tyrosine-phosphatase
MDAAGEERPRAVLFLCGHNVVRSPMAAALAEQLFASSLKVASAGVRTDNPDPFVTTVMEEVGIDLSRHRPIALEQLADLEGLDFDLVISLSPEAHHAALGLTGDHPLKVEYWPTEDPTVVEGNREQRLEAYRAVRDQLMKRVRERFGAAPMAPG